MSATDTHLSLRSAQAGADNELRHSTAMTSPAISVERLARSFGQTLALVDVSFEVPPGSVCALLGRNGAGKTTAVRILTTLLSADSGRAQVAGFDVFSQADKVRTRIGVTGQTATMDELLTGQENLDIVGRFCHLGAATSRLRANNLLRDFDLVDAKDRLVKKYSGGMKRRLDLAASLIAEPQVLFLDEPTTGLDPISRREMWAAIRSLVSRGTTVLLTTQYLDEADQLADTIVVIDRGLVVAQGTPEQLESSIGRPHVRSRFPIWIPPPSSGCEARSGIWPKSMGCRSRCPRPEVWQPSARWWRSSRAWVCPSMR